MSNTMHRIENSVKNAVGAGTHHHGTHPPSDSTLGQQPSGSIMSGSQVGSTSRDIHPSSNLSTTSTHGTGVPISNTTGAAAGTSGSTSGVTGISGTSGASTLPSGSTGAVREDVTQGGKIAREGDRSNVQVISGETQRPVLVQSQLASNTSEGRGTQLSNLDKVVQDLGAAHNAHSGWLDSEGVKISEWGQGEIRRILEQTKGVQERLVAEAQAKQKALEEAHKVELGKMVQQLDAKKSQQLKELEDSLQRQLQAALDTSKKDINRIESEMNDRKMGLLKQMQVQTAKDVDRLSSLQVQAKLVPSHTRTIIETNTETGLVRAVASGGEISTGSAQAEQLGGPSVRAVPLEGKLSQEEQAILGRERGVDGQGRTIMGSMTQLDTTLGPNGTARPLGAGLQQGSVGTSGMQQGSVGSSGMAARDQPSGLLPTDVAQQRATAESASLKDNSNQQGIGHIGEKQWTTPGDAGRPGMTTATSVAPGTGSTLASGEKPRVDAAYGREMNKPSGFNKHDATTTEHDTGVKHEGIMSKIKHAITGEPRTATATSAGSGAAIGSGVGTNATDSTLGPSHVHTQAPRNQPF